MIGAHTAQLPWRRIIDPHAELPEVVLVPQEHKPGAYVALSADRDVGHVALDIIFHPGGHLAHIRTIEVRRQGKGFGWAMYLEAMDRAAFFGARFCSDRRLSDEANAVWRMFTHHSIARETTYEFPGIHFKQLFGYVPRYITNLPPDPNLHTEIGGDF